MTLDSETLSLEKSHLPRALGTIVPGDHIIWLSQAGEADEETLERIFLDGLMQGHRIVHLYHLRDIQRLTTSRPDFRCAIELGQLRFIPAFDVFLAGGSFRPEMCVERLLTLHGELQRHDASPVRYLVDMTWVFEAALGAQRISELEARLHEQLPADSALWISHFNQQYFKPSIILDLLSMYPTVLVGSALFHNIYWLPRQTALAESRQASLLTQSIDTIRAFGQVELQLLERSAALNRSEAALEMLHSIIDSMGDGVLVVDEQGRMLFCNKSSENILGYGFLDMPMEERVRTIGNYLPDERTPFPVDQLPIARAIRGEPTEAVEYVIRNSQRPDGVWVSVNGRPLIDRSGAIRGGVVVFRDITQRRIDERAKKELEDQMFRTQKLESLGVLAGGIAHDLNNLLMGVLGNVDLALQELPNEAPAKSRLDHIRLAARRLSDLTYQLLAYSGKGSLRMERLSLTQLVQEMGELLRPAIGKSVRIKEQLDESLAPVECDPTQLRQVVMNLITNASDAIGDSPGSLSITTRMAEVSAETLRDAFLGDTASPGLYVLLQIEDTGCGMSPETLAKIFEPFYTTKFSGRGLGLAAVLGIVRRHRGVLRVESQLGRGTRFEVYLPAAAGSVASSRSTIVEPFHGSGTVLLVDDEPIVGEVAQQMLQLLGYEVLLVQSGEEAERLFLKDPDKPVLAILDISMPDIDGFQLLERLRKVRPQLPVILTSGFHEQEPRGAHSVLPSAYLQKPYGQPELIAVLRNVLLPSAPPR